VPSKRLELSHLSITEPKSAASTNSAKRAIYYYRSSVFLLNGPLSRALIASDV
jgi:hypothetical protein